MSTDSRASNWSTVMNRRSYLLAGTVAVSVLAGGELTRSWVVNGHRSEERLAISAIKQEHA